MGISLRYKKINQLIENASSIFIVGHKDIDLDSLGGCVAMYNYTKSLNKECYIILDDKLMETAVSKVINELSNGVTFINSAKAISLKNSSSLLIIVDTNKNYLLQNPSLAELFDEKIVIDHHEEGEGSISDGEIIIDNEASSTCEMITNFLKLNSFTIDSYLATILLSGIILDTNNYVLKTDSDTFYYSYYLTTCGANPTKVQYLLKQDLNKYIKRQKMVTNVKIFGKIAVTKADTKELYRREELAKTADTLLLFNNIEASFVVAKISKDLIGISARSMGNINVGQILGMFGGGGNASEAAAKISSTTITKIEKELINIIKLL